MNIENKTITVEELSNLNENEYHLTTKVILPIQGKTQIRLDDIKEALGIDKELRYGYAIWVWFENEEIPPLQLINSKGEFL
ncbi:MAG: hypothetical protein ACPG19_03510 [Saprospiraceae bacterium]